MEWFLKCVKEHYFDFNGRARRKEYWMFTLVNIIISVALSVVLGLISEKLLPIANLYSLAVLLPALGVTARRLHDINKSGWWMLIALIPIVGLYLIYLLAKDSDAGQNQYGQNPKGIPGVLPLPVSLPAPDRG
ncbi:DUF805 domain-containing protein [Pseudomonas aeruginosa]|nr:DUF805 domain-containing protein [Pseudomonas aeruginosa]